MNIGASLPLPWRCDQYVSWQAGDGHHAGRLTTWRGPTGPAGAEIYVLTVVEGPNRTLVTLHAPSASAQAHEIKEVARYA